MNLVTSVVMHMEEWAKLIFFGPWKYLIFRWKNLYEVLTTIPIMVCAILFLLEIGFEKPHNYDPEIP